MRYYYSPFTHGEASELFFLVEIILISIGLGVLLNSALIFILFVVILPIFVYYYKIKQVIIGVSIIGIVICAILGWYIGYFLMMFIAILFSDKSSTIGLIGGIIGATFFGFVAFSLNMGWDA